MVASSALGYGFIALTSVACLFSLISLFTPSWRTYGDDGIALGANTASFGAGYPGGYETTFGLITYSCGAYGNPFAQRSCYAQWAARSEWFVVLLMVIAIFAQIATLISACVIPRTSNPRYYFATPILAAISATFLLLAIVIYMIKNNYQYWGTGAGIGGIGTGGIVGPGVLGGAGYGMSDYYYHYGYSFWLAILSFIIMVIATIVGFLASKIYKDEAMYFNGRPTPAGPVRNF